MSLLPIQQLDQIASKRIDDNQWFDLNNKGSLCLRTRAQSCWEKTCEWFTRTFTYKMHRMQNQFQVVVNDFDNYLSQETDSALLNG